MYINENKKDEITISEINKHADLFEKTKLNKQSICYYKFKLLFYYK